MNKRHLDRIVNESIRRVIRESEGDRERAMDYLTKLPPLSLIHLYNECIDNLGYDYDKFEEMWKLEEYNAYEAMKMISHSSFPFKFYHDYFKIGDDQSMSSYERSEAVSEIKQNYLDELCEFVIEQGII